MKKVEQYIKECTKTCSNINLSTSLVGCDSFAPWLTPDQARRAVEIAREEIYEWLQENASKYTEKQDTIFGTIKVFNSYKLINDLKQAMKDE